MDYCDDVFIICLGSFWRHPFTLQRIHWWASDGILHFSSYMFRWRNKLISIMDSLKVWKSYANVYFWVTYSLNPDVSEVWKTKTHILNRGLSYLWGMKLAVGFIVACINKRTFWFSTSCPLSKESFRSWALTVNCIYLAASSSSSILTNCLGMCRESTLSAICSRTRRWFPSVVGNRYIREIVPPNTASINQSMGAVVTGMEKNISCISLKHSFVTN